MSEPIPVIANPFMAVAAAAAVDPAIAVAHPDPSAVSGETHENQATDPPTTSEQPESDPPPVHGFQEPSEPADTAAQLPPNLDLSTRPSLATVPGVEQASYVAQAPSTPTQELPVHPPESTPPGAVARQEDNVDPRVATLQAMFPDIEVSILQLILEESGGDTDTAIETLLAMSDPDYRPQPNAHAQQQRQPSVIDLDEQLAQRLQLEEEQAEERQQSRLLRQPTPRRYGGLGMQPPIGHGGQYPNQNMTQNQQNTAGMGAGGGDLTTTFKNFIAGASAKVSATGFGRGGGGNNTGDYNAATGQSQSQGQGPDYRQQFMEVAETGKRSFSTLLTKAKAKIQEFNTPQDSQGQQGVGQYPSYGGAGSVSQQQLYQQQYQSPNPYASAPAQSRTPPPQAGYQTTFQTSPVSDQAGYQVNPPRTSMERPGGTLNAPNLPTRSSFDTPEGSRASFDTSRMGLKPKKPVSLITANVPPSPTSPTNNKGKNRSDDDEIEYVTSPFEDAR